MLMNCRCEPTHLLMHYYYCCYRYYYSILHRRREAGQVILLLVVVNMFYQDENAIYIAMSVHFLTQKAAVVYST
jgi:hypothetical protein